MSGIMRYRSGPAGRLAVAVVATAVVLAGLGVGAVWAAARYVTAPLADGMYVLLVLGSDEGPPRPGTALRGRADGFHLIVVSPDHQHATVISFPRDSWVEVPGLGSNRINASLTRGPEVAVATVERLTGFAVDDWILTNFDGFILGVGELGGVEIEVEQRLTGAGVVIEPGLRRLGGTTALAYVRDRASRPGGDLARAESHARFLQAMHTQISAEGLTLDRVMYYLSILRRNTASSLSADRMIRLAALALSIPPENVERVTLDARIGTVGTASVVFLTDAAMATIADVREDGRLGTAGD